MWGSMSWNDGNKTKNIGTQPAPADYTDHIGQASLTTALELLHHVFKHCLSMTVQSL